MVNPYSMLGRKQETSEEVEGAFACQEAGCRNVSTDAVYFEESKRLEWRCSDGHKSEIEGFNL